MEFAYGPFHRLESPTQTPDDAKRQAESGEIWGREPSWGGWPQVQAYPGPLPEGRRGIEFWTNVRPDQSGHPFAVRWSQRGRKERKRWRSRADSRR